MLVGDDRRRRHDHYRGRLNHDDRGRWGCCSDRLTVLTFGGLVDAVGAGASDDYGSEQHCNAKGQCEIFKSVIHDDQYSWLRFGLAGGAEQENVIDNPITVTHGRLCTEYGVRASESHDVSTICVMLITKSAGRWWNRPGLSQTAIDPEENRLLPRLSNDLRMPLLRAFSHLNSSQRPFDYEHRLPSHIRA